MGTFKTVVSKTENVVEKPVVVTKKKMDAIFHNSTLICAKCLWHLKEYVKKVTIPDPKNPSRPSSENKVYYGCPNEDCENHGTSFSVPPKNVTLVEK